MSQVYEVYDDASRRVCDSEEETDSGESSDESKSDGEPGITTG